ncbi:MAG: protein TolR [Alphaproteobacteria bacterium]
MGVQMSSSARRSGGWSGRNRYRAMNEINVTPFVDVMLVLLIIFMITAPLLTVGVPVDLPKTEAKPITDSGEPLVVSVRDNGTIFLQETEIAIDTLAPKLAAISQNKQDTRIFVRGDKSVDYGRIMEVMGTLSTAGFSKVALIAEMPQGTSGKQPKN